MNIMIGSFLYVLFLVVNVNAQEGQLTDPSGTASVFLRSVQQYGGKANWKISKVSDAAAEGKIVSSTTYNTQKWLPAIVPGTVLNTLVANKVYPEPYFGDDNRKSRKLIPDLADAGLDFYHYWFRTEFDVPASFAGKRVWLKLHGINYRANIWVNGQKLGIMAGMFNSQQFDITTIANFKGKNVLAIDVRPVDVPGTNNTANQKRTGAIGENKNGGDGEIGRNVTMLMSVGWDFTVPDGIRDRNTGIWKDVELYATQDIVLENAFVQTKLPLPDTSFSKQIVSVEVFNASKKRHTGIVSGLIKEAKVKFEKNITLEPGERKIVSFTPQEFKQLVIKNPKLWWPINKGKQNLYTLDLKYISASDKAISHSISSRFGIREVTTDQNSPDQSRRFYVNGHPIFIRGTNWVPEAMLRNTEKRTLAELKYTKQSGLNFIRLWGGGIAESDYFYRLCDEMGFLVWSEFWITGDTRFPKDTALYFRNVESTVKRIRNHASSAYYVSANESNEIKGAAQLIHRLDSTKGYQSQSECCGIHDGSPYKYENPMQYFENTASPRGSRVDGFNPEYGTPILPTIESLRLLMPAKDLWPINDSVWNYLDGGGFHQMTTKYRKAVEEFGPSSSIEEYAKKAQLVGAMNYRAIWEVWNYNKFGFGDRFASGLLFWYHNSPLPQTSARMYDWSLEPTAALYYSQNGLEPLHPQFDYYKNTVSVYNDYRMPFANYSVQALVYDINSKEVLNLNKLINIPADGTVKDAIKIDFPSELSSVHFVKLNLKDAKGRLVSSSFYWRSNNQYKGAWTMTGPSTGGFQELNKLPGTTLDFTYTPKIVKGNLVIRASIKNSSKNLAFFNQVKLQTKQGLSVAPAYYTDNFFSLLGGESKDITIEVDKDDFKANDLQLVLDGWNIDALKYQISFKK